MRAGEIIGLLWEHVDLEAQTAFLPLTKNSDQRFVPLSSKAVELLKAMRGADKDRVFSLTSGLLDAYYRQGRAIAEVEGVTFHDARATAITHGLLPCVPIRHCQETGLS